MKKLIIIAVMLLIAGSALYAQSLYDNEYYRKSVEYSRLSEEALEAGEYDKSYEYAVLSRENAALSRQWIEEMVKAYRARTALTAARERMELANRLNIRNRDPDLYSDASSLFASANTRFTEKDYEKSLEDSLKVIELLEGISPAAAQEEALPEFYEVILNPARRDCLWIIAGYPFIYGDPTKWTEIYEANKKSFRYPDNPDLIFPGQILRIPAIKGETRKGTYNR